MGQGHVSPLENRRLFVRGLTLPVFDDKAHTCVGGAAFPMSADKVLMTDDITYRSTRNWKVVSLNVDQSIKIFFRPN